MRLHVREYGDGDRVAVLLHGFNCDSGDWWQLAPELVDRGYRVCAIDLRGHGRSPRADHYRLADFAADVVDTVHGPVDLIIGHSLGARVAGLAVDELVPARAIYLDPPWSPVDATVRAGLFPDLDAIAGMTDTELAATLRHDFPRWSERAISVDVASWRLWDPATVEWVDEAEVVAVPPRAVVPSLLVVADPSQVCRESEQRLAQQRGFEVREARGLSHSLFRDDFGVFVETLTGWI